GALRGGEFPDHGIEPGAGQPAHARPERTDPRYDHRVRAPGHVRIRGDLAAAAHPDDGPGHRAEVPHAVVEDGDHARTPLVDGGPPPAPRTEQASPSARARALNSASTMWCGLRPETSRACSVIPAAVASARTKSSV